MNDCRLETSDSDSTRELLNLSVPECKRSIVDSLRQHAWHQAWLLPFWKQQATFALSATLCRFLNAAAVASPGLQRYIPDVYLEGALDLLHSVRRAEPRAFATAEALQETGLESVADYVVSAFADPRVVNPEAKGMLLQTLWLLAHEKVGAVFLFSYLSLPSNFFAILSHMPALMIMKASAILQTICAGMYPFAGSERRRPAASNARPCRAARRPTLLGAGLQYSSLAH
jgi:hypothetical protein